MKIWTIILMFSVCITCLPKIYAQDGSDIMYIKIGNLDSSFIGDFVHLDFYNESLSGNIADTVFVSMDGQNIRFVEYRKDDGYNNWFNEQYLETIDKLNGLRIRIVKSRLDSVSKKTLFVTNFVEYFDNDNKPVVAKSRLIKNTFSKDDVKVVLVNATYHNKRRK